MAERTRGLLDTSVVIDHDIVDASRLPDESAISSVTLAELAAGPHATRDAEERARRQDRLQWVAATWDPLPFDADAARVYGRVFAAVRAAGRTPRARLADLLIASTDRRILRAVFSPMPSTAASAKASALMTCATLPKRSTSLPARRGPTPGRPWRM